jgi:glycosyltransferase involved in cell wall biosynthesis
VVLIVFNGEDFIVEAMESAAGQTYGDWELVIVDDGSTDSTPELIEAFARAHGDRVRIVRHPGGENLGMSATRNLGIREARGEYVTFLDHDDAMLPEKLERQVRVLDEQVEVAAVIGPNVRWYSWSGGEDSNQDLRVRLDAVVEPPGMLPEFLVHPAATPQAFMVRRSVLEELGGFDSEFRGMYEDQVFLARLLTRYRVYVMREVLHKYRQHEESCVVRARRNGTRTAARRRFLGWLDGYLDTVDAGVASRVRPAVRSEVARLRFAKTRDRLRRLIGLARR